MQAVILAAGKGSRLHPITTSTSKAMLPILGKPIVERVMESIAIGGLRDFILVISPDDDQIKDYFESVSELDVGLRFVYQTKRLGMADALKQVAHLLQDDFILSACDNLVSQEDVSRLLSEWRSQLGLQGLLTLIRVSEADIVKMGIVSMEGDRVRGIIEKPDPDQARTNIASMPLYCFSPRILDFLSLVERSQRGEYELQDAIQMLIEDGGDVRGLFFQNRFTLTTATDLLEINRHFLEMSEGEWRNVPKAIGPGTQLLEPFYIDEGTVIGSGCIIGPNVYIGKHVQIGNSVRLENVVVLQDTVIQDGVEFSNTEVVKTLELIHHRSFSVGLF
jgi:NDP-sugar pyrophosphorylase family protein